MRTAIACLAAVSSAAACSSRPPVQADAPEPATVTPRPSVLDHVPRDTPYLFFVDVPAEPALATRFGALGEIIALAGKSSSDGVAAAIEAALGGRLSLERLEAAGIDASRPAVLYGLGIYPIVRLGVSKASATAAAIDRLLEKIGAPAKRAEIEGRRLWTIDVDKASIVIAVSDGQLAVAAVAANLATELAPAIAGSRLPRISIAADFGELKRRHRVRDRIALLDLVSMTRATVGLDGHDVGPFVVPSVVEELSLPIPDTCRRELVELAKEAPRVIFGLRDRSGNVERSVLVAELSATIRDRVAASRSLIPGLGGAVASEAELTIGLGVRPPALLEMLADALEAIGEVPDCGLATNVSELRAALQTLATMTAGVGGASIALTEYHDDVDDFLEAASGVAGVLLDDRDRFYAAVRGWLPASQRNRTTRIPSGSHEVFVHPGDDVFALSVGLPDPSAVDEFVNGTASTESDLARIALRGAMAEAIQHQDPDPELEAVAPEVAERLAELLTPARYRSVTIDVRAIKDGIEMVGEIEYVAETP